MKYRKLRELKVSAIGYGAMGFTHGYGATPPKEEAIRMLRMAADLGCTFYDTAESYGDGANEELLGEALAPFRNQVAIATKLNVRKGDLPDIRGTVISKLETSLKKLQTDHVELYYLHRVREYDGVSMEEIAAVMGDLIREGKILGWGMSEVTAEQIRRANAITPLTAVQNEFSMMERKYEAEVIPACKELEIGFVPYSPLASGFLSGRYNQDTVYTGKDLRRVITRFEKENVVANQPLVDMLNDFAVQKNATPAQISLAWMLHKEPFIVPIPGMRKPERVRENLGAADIVLTEAEYGQIEAELAKFKIYGNRTDEDIKKIANLK